MRLYRLVAFGLLVWGGVTHVGAQTPYATDPIPTPPYHWLSEVGEDSCFVKAKVFIFSKVLYVGHALPTWKTIRPEAPFAVLEGRVGDRRTSDRANVGTSVSYEDFPSFHYTHDYTVNVWPDSTADRRFLNLLPQDTNAQGQPFAVHDYLHCEWESGLGARNRGNIATTPNRRGESAGFFSAGHRAGETLWAWPTIGDWVHLEGAWMFDRGHPPAYTELHPIHFSATRRHLPVPLPGNPSIASTRVDIFASGDGGAHWNNRPDVPDFVRRVPMARKDYTFCINASRRPNATAALQWQWQTRPGDNFRAEVRTEAHPNGTGGSTQPCVCVTVPWKTAQQPDTAILARTMHIYWATGRDGEAPPRVDEPDPGSIAYTHPSMEAIATGYRIELRQLRIRKIPERWPNRMEMSLFLEVGGQWHYLNEWFYGDTAQDGQIRDRMGLTRRRRWNLNRSFTVYLPAADSLRIHLGGWDADGIDYKMGILDFNPYAPCCCDTLGEALNRAVLRPRPVGWHGCEDDRMGYLDHFITPRNLNLGQWQRVRSRCGPSEDNCPMGRKNLDESLELEFRIVPLEPATGGSESQTPPPSRMPR